MFNSTMPMPSGVPSQSATPERLEVEKEEPHSAPKVQWQQTQGTDEMHESSTEQPPRAIQPIHKRRRVSRACDECRRKKIKCDGKQPCTHCTVYSYECTFDQPSNRRRNPAPQYIEALENRLQRAEALLRTFIPNIDLSDPNFEAVIAQRKATMGGMGHQAQMHVSESNASEGSRPSTSEPGQDDDDSDAQLRSMIETTGQLEIDERGHFDFHGGSSGAVFLKRMREQFDGLLGSDHRAPFLPRVNTATRQQQFTVIESPRSSGDSPTEPGLPNVVDLPSRQVALSLVGKALNCACALLRFVHHPSFYKMFNRIYDTPPENFGDQENTFLPLLYVTLALGCMFVDDNQNKQGADEVSYKEGIEQGLKYFKAARGMMDITDCRDMSSLQAILFMILFLQSSANLSTCYSYIGIALRSALRMGLHRNLTYNFNPIERETRRRVFWIIRKMDTYVAALLGFPKMLSDADVDQELPIEVDDEYITETEIHPMPPGKLSVFTASNAHTRLMAILAKVIREIYPTKAVQQCLPGSANPTYVISHAKIKEIEVDLQDWLDKLPMGLRPGGEATEDIVRVQQLLRMAYAHVQMMLYRPFLHYVSSKHNEGKPVDERSYACAAACVSVSRNIVHITAEMQRRGLLIGAYWFTMYTTFFAILSLAFFVLENPTKQGTEEILANASAGRDALKALARTSMAADRCSKSLTGLFEQLRIKVAESRSQNAPEKSNKRRSMGHQLQSQLSNQGPVGANGGPSSYSSPVMPGLAQRSLTFPAHPSGGSKVTPRSKIERGRYTPTSMSDPNLRQTFQNLMTPGMDSTGTTTPDSISSPPIPRSSTQNQGNVGAGQDFYPPFSDAGLTDLSAMMFPSADPFAYPNQPMLSYDSRHPNGNANVKAEFLGSNANTNPAFLGNSASTTSNPQNMFLSNVGPNTYKPTNTQHQSVPSSQGGIQSQGQNPNQHNLGYDNLEGQLFGPLPPYLMDQQGLGMGMDLSGVTGLDPLGGGSGPTGYTPGLNAGQGWEDMFGEWTTPGDLPGGGEMKGF